MTSYITLLSKIEQFCNAHLQIKKYGGEFREQMPNFSTKDEKYPVVFVEPVSDLEDLNTNQFSINVYCVDIIQKDRANLNTIVSDCQLILKDMYVYYINDMDAQLDVVGTSTMTPVNNFDSDYVAGWVMSITFEVSTYGACEIPMNPIEPVEVECEPGNVENSDGSYQDVAPSGEILVLPDVHLVVYDEDGNVLSDEMYPSVQDQDITVTIPPCADATYDVYNSVPTLLFSGTIPSGDNEIITAPDATIHLRKESNGTIHVEAVPSGVTENYIVADNDITVNQVNPFSIHATDPLNIRLHNQSGGDITPQSVVYQGNSNHVTITVNTASFTPVGATLMKTGQTTSYRTGDDGDIEAGRATSFTVLASNNPFGNTNRFTDELGGQTYTKNIVIDWSTYNGSNVLGYYRTVSATNITWNAAIDAALALSITGFTSGWRLPNKKEIENIFNYSLSFGISYSPFSFPNAQIWTSTTYTASTTLAYVHVGSWINLGGKTGADARWIACRTFTVTGTTLS